MWGRVWCFIVCTCRLKVKRFVASAHRRNNREHVDDIPRHMHINVHMYRHIVHIFTNIKIPMANYGPSNGCFSLVNADQLLKCIELRQNGKIIGPHGPNGSQHPRPWHRSPSAKRDTVTTALRVLALDLGRKVRGPIGCNKLLMLFIGQLGVQQFPGINLFSAQCSIDSAQH